MHHESPDIQLQMKIRHTFEPHAELRYIPTLFVLRNHLINRKLVIFVKGKKIDTRDHC